MTALDLLLSAAGNLWRMKLRASLTIAGVVIAIAAFVAMLSFGAGMQENISDEFNKLGLFSTMHVYPLSASELAKRNEKKNNRETKPDTLPDKASDSATDSALDTLATADDTTATPLDSSAIVQFVNLPGVNFAYPFDNYEVTVKLGDTEITTSARTLPVAALSSKLYSNFDAGAAFDSDTGHTAIVTGGLLEKLGLDSATQIVGQRIIVSVSTLSLDSAIAKLTYSGQIDSFKVLAKSIEFDSIRNPEYRSKLFNRGLSGAFSRFLDGYMNSKAVLSDTLLVTGALEGMHSRRTTRPVMFTVATGQRLSSGGFSGNRMELLSALASGQLFESKSEPKVGTYKQVTLDLDPNHAYQSVKDTVEALGFRTFSYAEEFAEIQQVFLYINMALGLIGMIALVTASLGIVNTMVMSILERRREIGVLKSLGADDSDIKLLYLFESGMIGSVGALGGILVGWLISRAASFVSQQIMIDKGVDPVELFALPLWLVGIAFAIGLIVSLIAGYYPAARAARVDPVQALRAE